MSDRLAVVPGTFNPPTNGHVDMIARAAALFDRVVVALLVNPAKQPLFSVAERIEMLREIAAGLPSVEVDTFDGLLAELRRPPARGGRRAGTADHDRVRRGVAGGAHEPPPEPGLRDRVSGAGAGPPGHQRPARARDRGAGRAAGRPRAAGVERRLISRFKTAPAR